MTSTRKLVLAIVGLEVVSAAFVWRDLAARPDTAVRGSKRFWRVIALVNPGNSLLYWMFGRR
ncbi:MAG: hypothetical protein ACRDVW_06675 [Acidimicrobiales bacterium]